ncbi:MAG: ribosome small subunit-dependent GTPase A [Fimbriimonas sp.]
MNPEQRNELRRRLAEVPAKDRKELARTATERRALAQKDRRNPRARWDVEQWTLHLLKEAEAPVGTIGTVVSLARQRCRVRVNGEDYDCTLVRELAERQQTSLAPGDEVTIEPFGEGWRVRGVQPRRTVLTRQDPGNREIQRAIVANADVVIVVVSVVAPPLHPRLIDRYLAAIHRGGAEAMIVVNKTDLHEDEAELARDLALLDHFVEIGIPVHAVSTETGKGLERLRADLEGRTCVFVGHSGVGKSSLLAAMVPSSNAEAGAVSAGTGKGRHTTTSSELVEADGLRIVDTPGVREFAVEFRDPSDLAEAFPDLIVGRCRFGDCLHREEPGCAVREAVQAGRVPRARYTVYRRLLADLVDEGGEEPPDERVPSFTCEHCGSEVPRMGGGTQHRNHCPRCLYSRHLDVVPGDRAAACGGVMEPIAVWVRRGGEWAIVHRCRACAGLSSNRIAADDNEVLLLSLAVRPLSQPPFPLDRVATL